MIRLNHGKITVEIASEANGIQHRKRQSSDLNFGIVVILHHQTQTPFSLDLLRGGKLEAQSFQMWFVLDG